MDIPHILIEQVREGRAVLFLGSGAAKGAEHPSGKSPPDGAQLAEQIAKRFLGAKYVGRPLDQIASLAVSETDLVSVQEFVADIFRPFTPAAFHKLVPRFVWSAIATTNYDLILERAYDSTADRCQNLVPFISDTQHVNDLVRDSKSLPYLKLHGCVTTTSDKSLPLILTPEQYITHRENRTRLFDRLIDYAHELPIIFVGYSLADIDLRAMLLRLANLNNSMPRSFMVAPHIEDADERYWAQRKLTSLKGTFLDFMNALNVAIDPRARKLATRSADVEQPISRHLAIAVGTPLPATVLRLVTSDAEYVHGGLTSETVEPRNFYKGYSSSWSPILSNLDVQRTVSSTIQLDYIVPSEEERTSPQELVVIKGHAGSGKSVLLRRIAWEASSEFDRLCLYVLHGSRLDYDALYELCMLAKKRIYLFIEPASQYRDTIQQIMSRARRDKLRLTVFTADRHNAWSAHCDALETHVSNSYELRYLNQREIDELISLLDRHKSLGHLASLDPKERQQALQDKAGRNLLVALHEATLGKPFSDIIFDEYNSIPDEEAKTLYRSVCILHRLNVPLRAGLLSRVHKISLTDFKERLFKPLEGIVFVYKDAGWSDFSYRSRHQHIAEMVFDRVLVDAPMRFTEYTRIIVGIDVGYDADRDALRGLASGKELRRLFPDVDMVRKIFSVAKERDKENAKLLQQEAIAEMIDSPERAHELLLRARAMRPGDTSIEHSLAELNLRRSISAATPLEKRKYRDDARHSARALIARPGATSHPYHTLLKVGLEDLNDLRQDADASAITASVTELESLLLDARQRFPDDTYLLEAEAKLSESLNRHPRALSALQQAFLADKGNAFITSRLSGLYEKKGELSEAIRVLKESLDVNAKDKDTHYRLATLLMVEETVSPDILYHLRLAFTPGDSRHIVQFWYARALYLSGDFADAQKLFRSLGDTALADSHVRQASRGEVRGARYEGSITRLEGTYAFIRKDGDGATAFAPMKSTSSEVWNSLAQHLRVSFKVSFNYRGLVATDVQRETPLAP